MSTQSIRSIVQLYAGKAKLERHITPHSFRHTTATLLLENGTDIRVVQQLLGHSSITMTQKYTHISDMFQRKSITLNHPRNSL
jgi:integrase/recombinase XerD